jgi:hypothetical protein
MEPENPLLGKNFQTNTRPTIGHPLVGIGPVNTSRGNEYATIGSTSIAKQWTCFLWRPPQGYITVTLIFAVTSETVKFIVYCTL